jgi:hypothetical protein
MHVLVRDASYIHGTHVVRDVAQRPMLRIVRCFTDSLCPYDTIDVVLLGVVNKTIPLRVEGINVLALKEVQGINAGSAMSVHA